MKLQEVEHKALAFTDDIFLLKRIKQHLITCPCCRQALLEEVYDK